MGMGGGISVGGKRGGGGAWGGSLRKEEQLEVCVGVGG